MRQRVDQLGVAEPDIQRSGTRPDLGQPPGRRERRARRTAGRHAGPARLLRLGGEPSSMRTTSRWPTASAERQPRQDVLLSAPARRPGRPGAELYAAATQAAKRPPIRDATTSDSGRQYWLFEKKHAQLPGRARRHARRLHADAPTASAAAAGARSSTIQPGTLILQATRRSKGHNPPANQPDRPTGSCWPTTPRLLGTDIKDPRAELRRSAAAATSRSSRSTSRDKGARRVPGRHRRRSPSAAPTVALPGATATQARAALRDRARPQARLGPVRSTRSSTRTASTAPPARRSPAASRSSRPRTSPSSSSSARCRSTSS